MMPLDQVCKNFVEAFLNGLYGRKNNKAALLGYWM